MKFKLYCNRFDQRIARQRLDKHSAIRANNNRTNVYRSLLGNSQLVNELAWWESRDTFSIGPRRRFVGNNKGRLRAVVGWRVSSSKQAVILKS
jgi:hypothetical protein